jgi:catechol 2,3-dioxygenase-like lactoylglutathione lyase family enzyme
MLPNINAVVLIVGDLDKCVAFYRDAVGLDVTFSDDVSYAFRLGQQDFVLLSVSAAGEMVGAEAVGKATGRVLLCAGVENVDNVYKSLSSKGVAFLKPPDDKPWGRRTAYFADPEGNLWELYHHLTPA